MGEHEKHYLGDGAYYRYDGFSVWLTTENGVSTTNTVCLEPPVLVALLRLLGKDLDCVKLCAVIKSGGS